MIMEPREIPSERKAGRLSNPQPEATMTSAIMITILIGSLIMEISNDFNLLRP